MTPPAPPDPLAESSPTVDASAEEVQAYARSSNAFGLELYRRLSSETPGNLVMSPLSVAIALAMTYGGARGQTAAEMKKTLALTPELEATQRASGRLLAQLTAPTKDGKLRIANRLFGEQTMAFHQPFVDATRAAYGAPLATVDFKGSAERTRRDINAWVERQTEKLIKDLITEGGVDSSTRLVLVNAIYFLMDWAVAFDQGETMQLAFKRAADAVSVPTMTAMRPVPYGEVDEAQVIELPYKGNQLAMVFVLPKAVDGLAALERSMTSARVDALVKSLEPQSTSILLPKFKIEPAASSKLREPLSAMGLSRAFSPDADFSGMSETALQVSEVFHKGFIRVDEQGTEAAAATAVTMKESAAPVAARTFRADHPFLYMLRDRKSGAVLFMGKVTDPSLTS